MVITGEDGIIQLANSRTDSLFGYPREQLIGLNIRCLIPQWECPRLEIEDGDESPATAVSEEAYADPIVRAPAEARVSAVCQNGSSFPAELTPSPSAPAQRFLVPTAILTPP